jgi:Zn-dependent protease
MDINVTIFFFIVIAISAIIHEYSHGWMADRLGDPTAKLAGRLTLNPIAHIDPIGTLLVPAILLLFSGGTFLFAFAKPVPVNPYNIRDKRWGLALVSIAGPGSNFLLALIFGLLIRFLPFFDSPTYTAFISYLGIVVYANLLLFVFNLIPIPPLDGSKVLFAILPEQFHNLKIFLQTYGLIFLFIFIFFLFPIIIPVISFLFRLITGYPLPGG